VANFFANGNKPPHNVDKISNIIHRSEQAMQNHPPYQLRKIQPGELEQRLEAKKRFVQKENALPSAPVEFIPPNIWVQQSNMQRVRMEEMRGMIPARETFIDAQKSSSSSSPLNSLTPST
jgi:hypothetical protein